MTRPTGQIQALRLENARLDSICALQSGGMREVYILLLKAEGGSIPKAIKELERFLSIEEVEALRARYHREPCP